MRWFRQKGRPNYEYCTELVIDFDEQKVAFRSWDNYPKARLDPEAKNQKEAKVFTFEEIGGERFREHFSYLTEGGFDYFFGEGAERRVSSCVEDEQGKLLRAKVRPERDHR